MYNLDERGLQLSGNIPLLATDKDFGMGEDHPIVWYGEVGKGRSLYSALGHSAASFMEAQNLILLKNAIEWAGRK